MSSSSHQETFNQIESALESIPEGMNFKELHTWFTEKIGRPFNEVMNNFKDDAAGEAYCQGFKKIKDNLKNFQEDLLLKFRKFGEMKHYHADDISEVRDHIFEIEERLKKLHIAKDCIVQCGAQVPSELEQTISTCASELEQAQTLKKDMDLYFRLVTEIRCAESSIQNLRKELSSLDTWPIARKYALGSYNKLMDNFIAEGWKDLALRIIEAYNSIPERVIGNGTYSLDPFLRMRNRACDDRDKYFLMLKVEFQIPSPIDPKYTMTSDSYVMWGMNC